MSKTRITLGISIGFFLAGGFMFYAAVQIALPRAAETRGISMLQGAVQAADEVDVSFLSNEKAQPGQSRYRTKAFPEDYTIVSTRRLTSEETKEFLGILKQHGFTTNFGAPCHEPEFVLRFARGGHTILNGSLCLHCSNIEIESFPFYPIYITIFDP